MLLRISPECGVDIAACPQGKQNAWQYDIKICPVKAVKIWHDLPPVPDDDIVCACFDYKIPQ